MTDMTTTRSLVKQHLAKHGIGHPYISRTKSGSSIKVSGGWVDTGHDPQFHKRFQSQLQAVKDAMASCPVSTTVHHTRADAGRGYGFTSHNIAVRFDHD